MQEQKKEINKIKLVENRINQKLFIICAFVTLAAMSLLVVEFFSRGRFIPSKINFFYLGILVIYSLHKEIIRWLGERKKERNGEYFVYSWIVLTTALYIINFLNKDYFSYSYEGYPLGTLRDISVLTLEVLGIFIITRSLKLLKIFLKKGL